jgi:hypothetical protein
VYDVLPSLSGCGEILWAHWNFIDLYVWDKQECITQDAEKSGNFVLVAQRLNVCSRALLRPLCSLRP